MAKGIGLIGNFKGKVGNTVGYKLTASNNGQTQGIRVYQPIVKNPKSAGQAEQRAKLLPINATYRALKMVIDRGNEGLTYGNKSRLAWLKSTMASFSAPWFEKGSAINVPVLCNLTKGSLPSMLQPGTNDELCGFPLNYTEGQEPTTVGAVAALIIAQYPQVKAGDQLTFVTVGKNGENMMSQIDSIVVDPASTDAIPGAIAFQDGSMVQTTTIGSSMVGAIITSREGSNGEHLRSTTSLHKLFDYDATHDSEEAKAAAIASYRASAASNSDWAEESIQ